MAKWLVDSVRQNFAPLIFRLAIVMVAIAILPIANADASRYKRIAYGGWKGGIYINDKTGEFSHCAVSADYKSGITLLFSVTRSSNWQVGFSKKTWNLKVGSKYNVRYQVDRHKVFSGKARAATKKLAVIKLPATARLFNQMRRGRVLLVKAGDDLLKFNLTGTKRMLARLLRCSKRNKYLVVNRSLSSNSTGSSDDNPFSSGSNNSGTNNSGTTAQNPPPKKSRAVSAAHRQEAQQWFRNTLANNLASSGATYRVIKNEGKAARLYKRNAIVWRVGQRTGIIGSMRIITSRPPSALSNRVLANEARICKGDFASKFLKDEVVSSKPIVRLITSCNLSSGKQWNAYYAIGERPGGGSYVVTLLSSKATADAVLQAGDRVSGSMQIVSTTTSRQDVDEDDLPVREDDGKVVTY